MNKFNTLLHRVIHIHIYVYRETDRQIQVCLSKLLHSFIFLVILTFKVEGWWYNSVAVLNVQEALGSIPIPKGKLCVVYTCAH